MKIRKIQLDNNPVFGNIEFDFCDKDGNVLDTIILAGENGCGKTTLLDIIYEFSIFSSGNLIDGEKRIFSIQLEEIHLQLIKSIVDRPQKKPINLSEYLIVTFTKENKLKAAISYVDREDGEIKGFE